MALGTILKWGAAAAGAVIAWKYVARPWLARRAARKLVVVKGKVPVAERGMREAINSITALMTRLKVNGSVSAGVVNGVPVVSVRPDSRQMVAILRAKLPDDVNGVPVVVS